MRNRLFAAIALVLVFCAAANAADVPVILHRLGKMEEASFKARGLAAVTPGDLEKQVCPDPRKALELGGALFLRGDFREAFQFFRRSAEGRLPEGLLLTGWCLLRGKGTETDRATGAELILKAAAAGHPAAQYVTGALYEEGYGVSKNRPEADKWYIQAKENDFDGEALIFEEKWHKAMDRWGGTGAGGSSVSGGGRTKDFGNGVPVPIDTLLAGEKAQDPSSGGISLETVGQTWKKLSSATGFSAYLLYDPSDVINAMIVKDPQGDYIVIVCLGLLEILRTEDEIAAVLAHEIGHGINGHQEKTMQQRTGLGFAVSILSSVLGGGLGGTAAQLGGTLACQGYSREQEVEADDFSVEACARAGFSPWGLYDAILKMADAGAVIHPSGFNSHPPTERRMKHLREKAEYWESHPPSP